MIDPALLTWAAGSVLVILWVQAGLRRSLFAFLYQSTRRPGCALRLFSLAMLPGTLLHEMGHVAGAWLVGARVSKVSLTPKYDQKGIELGSIVATDVGTVRGSVISIAPVVLGSVIVLLIGWLVFDFPGVVRALQAARWEDAVAALLTPLGSALGWLGIYAMLIVSINMLPSTQDIRSGGWVAILIAVLGIILWIVFLTQGDAPGDAAHVTNATLSWLSLTLSFVAVVGLPILVLLKMFTR